MSGVRQVRGRHARDGLPDTTRTPAESRRSHLALAGGAGLAVTMAAALIAFAALIPSGSGGAPKAAAVNVLGGRPAAPVAPAAAAPPRPAHAMRGGDQAVLAYFEDRDPLSAAHVTEAVWTGPMLRVYTDLPAGDADSKTAVGLCETAAAYLTARDRIPEVFVHADRDAGYPVLANKMDARDDCRLARVP
ncbi:hypothetical protein [Actinoallomurus bryophytorum]|uniref:hypothetical protein n=1 Tax=Actinoallomurus bryophytorum TaxID=1490222 RepID=UPI0011506775|nr:hypothetical protein [Actinoallomurus bryophytorum]